MQAMGVVFCITLLPSQYLVKLLGLALGALYWHAIPVLAAIPPADRARYAQSIVHEYTLVSS